MGDFSGKVVLVTGAGRGVGRALAEAFVFQGALVAANDISPVNLNTLVEQIKKSEGQVRVYVDDVAKKVAVQAIVNQVLDDWGQIDILVNSANVEPHFPLLDIDEWDWHRAIDVNLTGAFLMMQSVGRVMRQQGNGVIVNIAPIAGRPELPDQAAYVASKMGLVGLTQQAAHELFPYGIRVHAVCTGFPECHTSEVSASTNITEAVLYLCGASASHLNGQIMNIPG